MQPRGIAVKIKTSIFNKRFLDEAQKAFAELPKISALEKTVYLLNKAYAHQDYIACREILSYTAKFFDIPTLKFKDFEKYFKLNFLDPSQAEIIQKITPRLKDFLDNNKKLESQPMPIINTPPFEDVNIEKKILPGFKEENIFMESPFARESIMQHIKNLSSIFRNKNYLVRLRLSCLDYKAVIKSNSVWVNVFHKKSDGMERTGWKFHVSIDDEDYINLSRGVNVVTGILIEEQIANFKFYRPDHSKSKSSQVGKQMTIYYEGDSERGLHEWKRILTRINAALSHDNIKPDKISDTDKLLNGSVYITYRNDKALGSGIYQPARYAKTYNDSNDPDIFRDMDLGDRSNRLRI